MRERSFVAALSALFADFPNSRFPIDRRFSAVIDAVPGMATENTLALLNLAARWREPGETYLEIGTWKGLSLVGAALGNSGPFVAIDDFSMRGSDEQELRDFLAQIGLAHVQVCSGQAAVVLRSDVLQDHRIGVCYYDADHSPYRQAEALSLVRPRLAKEALIILDNADSQAVSASADAWLRETAGARDVLRIPGHERDGVGWWHGVRVIAVCEDTSL